LDPHHHPDDIMSGVLQPGTGRLGLAAGGHDSELALLFGPAASGRGPQWVAGAERDSGIAALFGPAAGGRGPLLVDRVLDDLLRDDLRVSKDAWQRDDDDELEHLLTSGSEQRHDDLDDFFANL
ncbi:MAG: hypothetical protein KJ000_35605, partial [Pirellulaceae bacterium]|nr:hypothetical protein [Pirellulaceae bacterium]